MKLSPFAIIAALALGVVNLRRHRTLEHRTMKTIADLDGVIDTLNTTIENAAADIQAGFDDLRAKLKGSTVPPAEQDFTPEFEKIQAAIDRVHAFDPGPVIHDAVVPDQTAVKPPAEGASAPVNAGHATNTGLHVDAQINNPVDYPAAGGPVPTVSTPENPEPHPATEFPNTENAPAAEPAPGGEPAPAPAAPK